MAIHDLHSLLRWVLSFTGMQTSLRCHRSPRVTLRLQVLAIARKKAKCAEMFPDESLLHYTALDL